MSLSLIGHAPGSPAEREWHATLAREFAAIGTRAYVVADAYTHAPITPYAPITGYAGIAADIARDIPGMTALEMEAVSPERRAHFAHILEGIARTELAAWERNTAAYDDYAARGHAVGMANTLARGNRAAAESDRCSDRAHAVRRSL